MNYYEICVKEMKVELLRSTAKRFCLPRFCPYVSIMVHMCPSLSILSMLQRLNEAFIAQNCEHSGFHMVKNMTVQRPNAWVIGIKLNGEG